MTTCRAKQASAAGHGWVYGYYVRMTAEDGQEPLHLIYTGKRQAVRGEGPSTPEWHRVSPETVGRSTGVTDIFKPYFSGDRLEVMGNIHDNPELIERNANS